MGHDAQQGRGILVVEDDADIRGSLRELLEDLGYPTCAACDGVEALQQLRSGETLPCMILLDLRMPRMDGYEFRTQQLQDPALAGIPVVVCTAEASAEGRPQLRGTVACLRKPFLVTELMRIIGEVC